MNVWDPMGWNLGQEMDGESLLLLADIFSVRYVRMRDLFFRGRMDRYPGDWHCEWVSYLGGLGCSCGRVEPFPGSVVLRDGLLALNISVPLDVARKVLVLGLP